MAQRWPRRPTAGLDAVMTLTSVTAGMSASFRCQGLQFPVEDPATAEDEFLLTLVGTARTLSGGASGGAEIIINNDNIT